MFNLPIFLSISILFALYQSDIYAQSQDLRNQKVRPVIASCTKDSARFWKDVNKKITYPVKAREAWASEAVQITLIYNPLNSDCINLTSSARNRYFAQEVDKIAPILKKHLKKNCQAFYTELYVYFDMEPFRYSRSFNRNGNIPLDPAEAILVKGYLKDLK